MKKMGIKMFMAAIMSVCAMGTNALALSINDPGVVGIAWGQAGDTGPEEAGFAQHILDLPANTVNDVFNTKRYDTSSTEYSGTIIGPGVQGSGGDFSVDAGWDYALAKYDGQNAGYVLFYLGGAATVLPEYSFSIWGDNEQQYQISHYTTFEATRSVPDGGSTMALLGLAMGGFSLIRRKLGNC